MSRIFVENFLSQSAENFCRGTLVCFRNVFVSETITDKRGGTNHDFASILNCSTLPTYFAEESLSVSHFLGVEKYFA